MRHFIIGDIHGCYDEMLKLLHKAGINNEDFIISVGDIVDRGPKSIQVYQFFKNRPNSKVIMGNHERKHLKGIYSYAQDIVRLQFGEQYDEFVKWIANLDYYYQTHHATVVHAALEPNLAMEQQKESVLAGTTAGDRYLQNLFPDSYWHQHYKATKPIIFGHHVTGDAPMIINNTIYGLDTGACHGGYLTGLLLPDFKIYQVKVSKDYWLEEKIKWQLPVLKAKDWNNWTFDKIELEIQRFRRRNAQNKEIQAYLSQLAQATSKTKNLVTLILEHILTTIKTFPSNEFNQQAQTYSSAPLFYMARANRLTKERILEKYSSPNKLLALAQELNLTT
ncbi:MAG: serine/threonine protein phosphatase [Aureispira sp.]|nr:serine/threonine protein phosphatase [Aureispira sp.]